MSDWQAVAPFGSELTATERRVIDVMRTARDEREAARILRRSEHTIHGHLRNARSRTGTHTTRELIAKVPA